MRHLVPSGGTGVALPPLPFPAVTETVPDDWWLFTPDYSAESPVDLEEEETPPQTETASPGSSGSSSRLPEDLTARRDSTSSEDEMTTREEVPCPPPETAHPVPEDFTVGRESSSSEDEMTTEEVSNPAPKTSHPAPEDLVRREPETSPESETTTQAVTTTEPSCPGGDAEMATAAEEVTSTEATNVWTTTPSPEGMTISGTTPPPELTISETLPEIKMEVDGIFLPVPTVLKWMPNWKSFKIAKLEREVLRLKSLTTSLKQEFESARAQHAADQAVVSSQNLDKAVPDSGGQDVDAFMNELIGVGSTTTSPAQEEVQPPITVISYSSSLSNAVVPEEGKKPGGIRSYFGVSTRSSKTKQATSQVISSQKGSKSKLKQKVIQDFFKPLLGIRKRPRLPSSRLRPVAAKPTSSRRQSQDSAASIEQDSSANPNDSTSEEEPLHAPDESKRKGNFCICGKRLASRGGLATHIRRFTQEWMFKCSQCEVAFFRYPSLKLHNIVSHDRVDGHGKNAVGCTKCGQIFTSKVLYQRHHNSVHGSFL